MRVDVTRVVKCHKGLSIVAMTLILLVISILLALIVALYALNITNRLPEENLSIHKHHIWYNSAGQWSEAGFVITNIGGRDAVLNKIEVRSQPCDWSTVYYWKTSTVTVTDEINVTSDQLSGSSYNIMVQGQLRNFTRTSEKLTLKSGWTIVLYIKNPITDVEDPWPTLTVHTANAPYSESCDLEYV